MRLRLCLRERYIERGEVYFCRLKTEI